MKKNLILTIVVLTTMLFSISVYAQTVTIGSQVWASKNLNVSTYRNGDLIPHVQDKEAWEKLTTGAWCYYDNDESNGTKYGKLYNWYAVNDPRGLAPNGYHIPTASEWETLISYCLGGKKVVYFNEAGIKMKSAKGWKSFTSGGSKTCPNCSSWNAEYRKKVPCHTCKDTRSVSAPTVTNSGNGSNSSGFSGLPGGSREWSSGDFVGVGSDGNWWSSSVDTYNGCPKRLSLHFDDGMAYTGFSFKSSGFSVRCLRDNNIQTENDIDWQRYRISEGQ
jgi:uncharacterized protein (TIGR02145 family)